MTLIGGANIAVWFVLYYRLHDDQLDAGSADRLGNAFGTEPMLLLCAAVFGCAFRSFLPRADVQRICLFDTWLSSVVVGRSVATLAEICFAAQWAIFLQRLGAMTGADTTLNAAWLVVPLIVIAQCFSWYGVLTTNYRVTAIENSIWAVAFTAVGIGLCRLLPDFQGPVRVALAIAVIGIAFYLVFLVTVDIPMYVSRWRARRADGSKFLRPLDGLRDASTRWVVTHSLAEWRDDIAWMSLYFSAAGRRASLSAPSTPSTVISRAVAAKVRSELCGRTRRQRWFASAPGGFHTPIRSQGASGILPYRSDSPAHRYAHAGWSFALRSPASDRASDKWPGKTFSLRHPEARAVRRASKDAPEA